MEPTSEHVMIRIWSLTALSQTPQVWQWRVGKWPLNRMPKKRTWRLPAWQMRVTVPSEYLRPYVEAGFTEFKFEVGAKSGQNQTFAEGTFTVELGD
jgi:hypothetical protein